MKNYKIGREINRIIVDSNIKGLGNKVFPLIANANTTFPFVVYRRSYYTPASNKDFTNEIVGVEIVVAATKYEESITIADKICDVLKIQQTDTIDEIKITNLYEDYVEDTFIQHINLDVYLT